MNREALEKWADALEFGNYQQATGHLQEWNDDKEAFCALGVATNEYAKLHNLSPSSAAYESLYEPEDDQADKWVLDWLGISNEEACTVVYMNDADRMSLPEIGAWVRDNWVKEQ